MVGNDLSRKSIKFMCSYGGRILPRYPDGKLRYHGGDTRVLSVERSASFSELLLKLAEMCGTAVSLRCQLPSEDLDALVSITSDEDLANLIEEYDRAAAASSLPVSSLKIRAFLFAPKPTKKVSPPPSTVSFTSPKSPFRYAAVTGGVPPRCPSSASGKHIPHASKKPPSYVVKAAGISPYHQKSSNHLSVTHGELIALHVGLKILRDRNYQRVHVTSDSLLTVQAVTKSREDFGYMRTIAAEIGELMKGPMVSHLYHIKWSVNAAAHVLAKFSIASPTPILWVSGDFPFWFDKLVINDL